MDTSVPDPRALYLKLKSKIVAKGKSLPEIHSPVPKIVLEQKIILEMAVVFSSSIYMALTITTVAQVHYEDLQLDCLLDSQEAGIVFLPKGRLL